MTMVTEYTGELKGGPNDGNLVSATAPEMNVIEVFEFWPDGPDKESVIFETKGKYVWLDGCFQWEPDETKTYTKKEM